MGLNDLSTKPVKDEVDFDNLPEQFGGSSAPPPPPGAYRFKMPKLGPDNFDAVNTDDYKDRMVVIFDEKAPLEIVQSLGGKHNGEPFRQRLTNVPRARNKERTVFASDVDYLLKALGVAQRPKTAKGYAEALIAAAGKEFSADIEWSWYSNPNKPARFAQEGGGFAEEMGENGQPIMGSGERWYQKDVESQKVDGQFPLYIADQNGAQVRAFPNLTRFRE